MCLAFRGHHEHVNDGRCEGCNFLALVAMQAQFDPLFNELIQLPVRATKYLSQVIKNDSLIRCVST